VIFVGSKTPSMTIALCLDISELSFFLSFALFFLTFLGKAGEDFFLVLEYPVFVGSIDSVRPNLFGRSEKPFVLSYR
jgi:hypothetical protein